MKRAEMKQNLVDLVIKDILKSYNQYGDVSSLEAILKQVPNKILIASLPDGILQNSAKVSK